MPISETFLIFKETPQVWTGIINGLMTEAFPPKFLGFLKSLILISLRFCKPQGRGIGYSEITFVFLDPMNYVSNLKLV